MSDPDRPAETPDVRQQLIDSDRGKCRHFNGTTSVTCKAGVNYRALAGGDDLGWGLRLPCGLRLPAGKTAEPVSCASFSAWSEEELATNADAHLARMEQFAVVHRAAKDDARAKGFKKGHGGHGEIACPTCGKRLRYSVAGYNGHMHASCETKGCASWME